MPYVGSDFISRKPTYPKWLQKGPGDFHDFGKKESLIRDLQQKVASAKNDGYDVLYNIYLDRLNQNIQEYEQWQQARSEQDGISMTNTKSCDRTSTGDGFCTTSPGQVQGGRQ